MSYYSMVRKSRLVCHIMYESPTVGDGAQLTKEWRMRHERVRCYVQTLRPKQEEMMQERQTGRPMLVFLVLYRDAYDTIIRDRIFFESRRFDIVKIEDVRERRKLYRIVVEEILRND